MSLKRDGHSFILSIIIGLISCLVFINGESFWIDEGNSMKKATQGSFQLFYITLFNEGGSDSQMPGYMAYIWLWNKLFGNGEYIMRLSNVPWVILMACFLRGKLGLITLLVFSPFTVYYLNELRPYAVQIALGIMLYMCLKKGGKNSSKCHWLFSLGVVLMCSTSLLGVVWAFTAILIFLTSSDSKKDFYSYVVPLCVFSPLLLLLGYYYYLTLSVGHQAATLGGNPLLSFGQAGYELIGLSGVGPGRAELREGLGILITYAIPIGLMLMCITLPIVLGFKKTISTLNSRLSKATFLSIVVTFLLFTALIVLKDFRLLGRHLAPIAGLVIFLYYSLFVNLSEKFGKKIQIIVISLAVGSMLVSSLSLRFADRHRKDDYRGAAGIVGEWISSGQSHVYWFADRNTGEYYNINLSDPNVEHVGSFNEKIHIPNQGLIVISKEDIYDSKGYLSNWLESSDFRLSHTLKSFKVYSRVANVE